MTRPSPRAVARTTTRRRSGFSTCAALLMRLIGLEMKLRQYETGAAFIAGVERHAGWSALDAAWASPENLPTLAEIENPVRWLERVG